MMVVAADTKRKTKEETWEWVAGLKRDGEGVAVLKGKRLGVRVRGGGEVVRVRVLD